MKAFLLLLFSSFFWSAIMSAQGTSCRTAHPACPDQDGIFEYPFLAGIHTGPDTGNLYGCLTRQTHSRWFLWKVTKFGSPLLELSNSKNFNVGYALWGPFADAKAARDTCGKLGDPIRCNNAVSPRQLIAFPPAGLGQVFLLLVTKDDLESTDLRFFDFLETGSFSCQTPYPGCGLVGDEPPGCDICQPFFIGSNANVSGCCRLPDAFCGKAENTVWMNFIAGKPDLTIQLSAYFCLLKKGVEAVITDVDMRPISNCFSSLGKNFSATLTARNLVPGETYYLMVDGYDGDVCEFALNFSDGLMLYPPENNAPIAGPTNVCPGGTATFSIPDVAGAFGYEWSVPRQFIQVVSGRQSNQLTVYFKETGNGRICVTPYNACNEGRVTCLDVTSRPVPTTILPDTIVCHMDFPVLIEGLVFDSAGTYTVTHSSYLGCDSTVQFSILKNANCLISNGSGGVKGIRGGKRGNPGSGNKIFSASAGNTEQVVHIFPNPVSDILVVQSDTEEAKTVEIYTISGRKIFTMQRVASVIEIPVSEFNTGTYFVKVRKDQGVEIQKFVKL